MPELLSRAGSERTPVRRLEPLERALLVLVMPQSIPQPMMAAAPHA